VQCPECGRTMRGPRVRRDPDGPVIRYNCPHCETRFSTPFSGAGLAIHCPSCSQDVAVPTVVDADVVDVLMGTLLVIPAEEDEIEEYDDTESTLSSVPDEELDE